MSIYISYCPIIINVSNSLYFFNEKCMIDEAYYLKQN